MCLECVTCLYGYFTSNSPSIGSSPSASCNVHPGVIQNIRSSGPRRASRLSRDDSDASSFASDARERWRACTCAARRLRRLPERVPRARFRQRGAELRCRSRVALATCCRCRLERCVSPATDRLRRTVVRCVGCLSTRMTRACGYLRVAWRASPLRPEVARHLGFLPAVLTLAYFWNATPVPDDA